MGPSVSTYASDAVQRLAHALTLHTTWLQAATDESAEGFATRQQLPSCAARKESRVHLLAVLMTAVIGLAILSTANLASAAYGPTTSCRNGRVCQSTAVAVSSAAG